MSEDLKTNAIGVPASAVGKTDANKQGTQRVVPQPAKTQTTQQEEACDTFVRSGASSQAETPEALQQRQMYEDLYNKSTEIRTFWAAKVYEETADSLNPFVQKGLSTERKSKRVENSLNGTTKVVSILNSLGDFLISNGDKDGVNLLKSFEQTCKLLGTKPDEFAYNFPGYDPSSDNNDSSSFGCIA